MRREITSKEEWKIKERAERRQDSDNPAAGSRLRDASSFPLGLKAQETQSSHRPWLENRLVGLVVRRPPRERKIPGSNPACAGIFSGSSHTSDFEIGTPVATLSGAWRYRVSTGTGRPGVSILWLGEVERLTCNLHLSVAARKIVRADPSLRYTSMLLGR